MTTQSMETYEVFQQGPQVKRADGALGARFETTVWTEANRWYAQVLDHKPAEEDACCRTVELDFAMQGWSCRVTSDHSTHRLSYRGGKFDCPCKCGQKNHNSVCYHRRASEAARPLYIQQLRAGVREWHAEHPPLRAAAPAIRRSALGAWL